MESRSFILTLALSLLSLTSFSQQQDAVVFDSNLDTINLGTIQKSGTIAVFTNKGCAGCIDYLLKERIVHNVIYIIDNLSISEARQVVSKNCSSCKNYFVLSSSNFQGISDEERGPVLLVNSGGPKVIRYDQLIELTGDFSLGGKAVKKKLKKI